MEWSEEKCLELINAYQQKELLWHAKHHQHFNRLKKQDAWEEIAHEINMDSEECKKKMSSLLSSFRRENVKMKKSRGTGSGRDDIYETSWFAFKAKIFLQDKNEPRIRLNTLLENNTFGDCEEREVQPADLGSSDTTENEIETPPPSRPLPRRTRKKINDERLDKAFSMLEASQSGDAETEHDICGKLIAKKLKNYSPYVSSMVQEDLMKILFKADRGCYDINNEQLPPTNSQTSSINDHQLVPAQYPSQTLSPSNQQLPPTQYPSQTLSRSNQQLPPTQYPSQTISHSNSPQSYHEL